jgi:Domain of unknown function (DUF5047)
MSDRMKTALQGSHRVVVTAEVMEQGELLATLPSVTGGNVQVEHSGVTRSGTVEIEDASNLLTPGEATDLLAPYGNDLRISRGVMFPDGTTELVPVATLRIATCTIEWPRIIVTGYDAGWVVSRARFTAPYTIPKGENYIDGISEMLSTRMPSLLVNFPIEDETTPLLIFDTDVDPWEQARQMAETIGYRLTVNPLGVAEMAPEPALDDVEPEWYFTEGENSVLLSITKTYDVEQTYNGVIVTGENTTADTPVPRAEAWDTDTSSPTHYLGKYGKVPLFFASPLVLSNSQAYKTALTILRKQLGLSEDVSLGSLVNPALDVGDAVIIRHAHTNVDGIYLLDSFNVPLRATDPMQASARTRRVVLEA